MSRRHHLSQLPRDTTLAILPDAMLRFLIVAAFLCACAFGQQPQQDPPSLADRAAALRKKVTPTPTDIPEPTPTPDASADAATTATPNKPAVKPTAAVLPTHASSSVLPKTTVTPAQELVCGYKESALGLEVTCPDGWTVLNAADLNARKAAQRPLLRIHGETLAHDIAGVAMRDASGGGIFLSVVKLRPSDPLPPNLRGEIQRVFVSDHPASAISEEPALLNDGAHHFAAFRAAYDASGVRVESVQAMVFQGYFIQFTVSASSQERVAQILQELKSHVVWSPSK